MLQVFERWMEWEPEEQAWNSYIKMELRYKELDRARGIYERFVQVKERTIIHCVWILAETLSCATGPP